MYFIKTFLQGFWLIDSLSGNSIVKKENHIAIQPL